MYLGIDLGTSNSAVVSYLNNDLRILKTVDKGTDVLPSAIYIDRRENKFYGHRAYEHLFKNPDNAVSGFKRQMGTSWKKEFIASEVVMNAEECSADILRQLIAQVKVEHGEQSIDGVVITTPAAFNQMQIEATRRAAEMAGIEKVALLQEPVAASLAAVAKKSNKDGLFLVYDIGGGTFDLALVQSIGGKVSIVAHEGINALGGRDFDRIIVNSIVRPWLLENFSLPQDFQKQDKYAKMIGVMRMAAEVAKMELSAKDEAVVYIPDDELRITDEDDNDIYIEITINRKNYEKLIADKMDETVELSRQILKDNGYQEEDIDQLIFIGGPSKTPMLREIVPQQLGIGADIDIDPMTAVALGAAIFCEGIDWKSVELERKQSRERTHGGSGDISIQYDYESRTPKKGARLRIKSKNDISGKGYEIQVDSTEGWSSGRKSLDGGITLELPLDNDGENHFRAMVFAANGDLIKDATSEIVITRTHAVADALKLTHNLSAMIVQGDGKEAENILHIFAAKGISLPAEGVAESFRVARDLCKDDDTLRVQLFEQSNKTNPIPGEPNLYVGSIIVRRDMLKEDVLHGDELSILWNVNESSVIKASVRLDKTGDVFGGEFFSPELGHRSYEGREGERLVADMLKAAKEELKEAEKLSETAELDLRKHKNKLEELTADVKNIADGEERRSICEKVRDVRQKIAGFRNDPKNIRQSIKIDLEQVVNSFDERCRANASDEDCNKFDELKEQAENELQVDDGDYTIVKRCIEEMHRIRWRTLVTDPNFLVGFFHHLANQRDTAISPIQHDELVAQGENAIENKEFNVLWGTIVSLRENQINNEGNDSANIGNTDSDIMAPR